MSLDVHVGIDYSMTSPAICIHSGSKGSWDINHCRFHYFIRKEKFHILEKKEFDDYSSPHFYTYMYPEYDNEYERFDLLSEWALDVIREYQNAQKITIEGFSYGSMGSRIFNMSENVGLLKHKLWKRGYEIETPAPSEIKKFASGKGNCNKETMYDSFLAETQIDLRKKLMLEKGWNPLSDIVDAYYIAKLGHSRDNIV